MDVDELASTIINLPVAVVINRWPATISVFNRNRMACVGCAIAPYNRVADAARLYGMVADVLALELATAIVKQNPDGESLR